MSVRQLVSLLITTTLGLALLSSTVQTMPVQAGIVTASGGWNVTDVGGGGGSVTSKQFKVWITVTQVDYRTFHFFAEVNGTAPPFFYEWNFGDGKRSSKRDVTHQYEPDFVFFVTYTVTLKAQDSIWRQSEDSQEITVLNWPVITTIAIISTLVIIGTYAIMKRRKK